MRELSFDRLLLQRELSGASSVLLYDARGNSVFQREVIRKRSLVRSLKVVQNLRKHTGCVNVAKWNVKGDKIISGSA
jgi:hypothetical protein